MADLSAKLDEMLTQKSQQAPTSQPQMPTAQAPAAQPAKRSSFGPVERMEYQQDVARMTEEVVPRGTLPDNGRVVRNLKTGEEMYVSNGMTTADPGVVSRAKQVYQELVKSQGREEPSVATPRQMKESEIRQELIGQAGMPGALGLKVKEGELFTGGSADEIAAKLVENAGYRDYESALADARALSKAMQSEHPIASEVAKFVGMISSLSPLAIAKNLGGRAAGALAPKLMEQVQRFKEQLAESPPLKQQAATIGGATVGAGVEGAVYGLGEGEDLEGRLAHAQQRGLMQMAFAAPIASVITTFGRFREGRKAGINMAKDIAAQLGVSVEAGRVIGQALDDGRTVEETIQLIRRAGDQGMIADSTEAAKNLLDVAVNASGKARDVGAANIEGRIGAQQSQLEQEMVSGLGQPKPPGQTVAETAKQRTSAEAGEAYKGARETPIDYASDAGMAIEDVINRIPTEDVKAAFGLANKLMQSEGKRNMQIMADIAENGTITFREMPNVMQLDYLKRSLQNMAMQNVDAFGKKNEIGMMYDRLAREVRDATAAAVPQYGKAVSLAREGFMDVEAGKLGEQLLTKKITVDDVIKFAEDASASEREAARLGLRNAIDNIIGDAKKAASRPGDMQNVQVMDLIRNLSSSNNRKKIAQLLGEDVATPMFKRLDEVSQGIQLRSTLGGSQTAARTAGREGLDEVTSGGVLDSLFLGEPKGFTGKIRDFFTGRSKYLQDRRDQITTEIVDVLTGRKGTEAELALRYIKEAIEKGTITESKASIIAKEANRALMSKLAGIESQSLFNEER